MASASVGGAIAGAILWALGTYVFHDDVPDAIVLLVLVLVPAVGAFIGGYVKKIGPNERAAINEGRL